MLALSSLPARAAEIYEAVSEAEKISVATPPAAEFPRFGFSLGLGALNATGNRGALWTSSNPMYDLAFYYWLTPELTIDLEGFTASNSFETSGSNGGRVKVDVKHVEFGTRYYGDLHALLSRVTPGFISPFAAVGMGLYSMTQASLFQAASEPADTQLGMALGAGLKFDIAPRTLALELLGRWNSVTFKDTYSSQFQASNGLADLTGQLVSWNANVLVSF